MNPAPVPTQIAFAEVRNNATGEKLIVVSLSTPVGTNSYFFDHASAENIGEQLLSLSSGIVIAPAGSVH